MGAAHQEHVEEPAVDPHRHPQGHFVPEHREPTHHAQGAAHLEGGPARPGLVLLPGEQQQQCVATELQKAPTVGVSDVEEGGEALPDGGRQFFGPDLAVLGQGLRQLGEARDINEGDGPVDAQVPTSRGTRHPIDDQSRQIGRQELPTRKSASIIGWRRADRARGSRARCQYHRSTSRTTIGPPHVRPSVHLTYAM